MAQLRRRLRRLLVLHGASRVTTVFVPIVALAAVLDWVFRLQDRGLRVMLSSAVAGALVWALYRFLWPAVAARLDEVSLALRIERFAPRLRGRLASGVEFERWPDDPSGGSPLLRSKVVEHTTAAIEKITPQQIAPLERLRVPLAQAGGVLAAALVVVLIAPTTAAIAVARLANPLGDVGWPRTHHLRLEPVVESLPRGETLELRVVDAQRAPLPDDLRIEIRRDDAAVATATETIPTLAVDGVAVARREQVRSGFFYRAVGGDDYTMEWLHLDIVDPPALKSVALALTPPTYTLWSVYDSPVNIRALAGASVSLAARADRPLRRAWLAIDERQHPLIVGTDQHTVTTPSEPGWKIEQSATYQLMIEDTAGIVGGRSTDYTIEAVADRAPTVSLDEPAADLYVTAHAVVPIRTTAKDDLRVRGVWIEFVAAGADARQPAESDDTQPTDTATGQIEASGQIELYESKDAGTAVTIAEWSDARRLDAQRVEYNWELVGQGLGEGANLELTVVARDDLGQLGTSQRRRLRIISVEQLRGRLAARQETIASELERALELQRHALRVSGQLRGELRDAARPVDEHRDAIQTDEASQREVRRLLAGSGGVREQFQTIEDALSINRLDDAELSAVVSDLGQQIERLTEQLFPHVFDRLVAAAKTIESSQSAQEDKLPALMRSLGESVLAAEDMQYEAAEVLAAAAARLSHQTSQGRFRDELVAIRREQLAVAEETAELARAAANTDRHAAQQQQRARLGERQQSLAERFANLRDTLADTSQASETAADVAPARAILEEATRRGIEPHMRQAAQQLAADQLGRAFDAEQTVAADIDELLRMLDELDSAPKDRDGELRELAQQASELARRQRELTDQWQQRAGQDGGATDAAADKTLADQQRASQRQADELARALSMTGQRAAAGMSQEAAQQMSAAAQAQAQGENPTTSSQHAAEAEQKLDELEEYLAEQIEQAEQDEAQQRLARLWQDLHRLRDIEDALFGQTRQIEQQRASEGRISRSAAAQLRDLAGLQQASHAATSEWSESLADIPMFRWALEEAAAEMAEANRRLELRDPSTTTQTAMTEASGRLSELLDALTPPEPKDGEGEEEGEGGGGGAPSGGEEEEEGGVMLAELVLLKTMQLRVNQQTDSLGPVSENRDDDAGDVNNARALADRQQLGERQRRLADMANRLREAILGTRVDNADAPPEQAPPQE